MQYTAVASFFIIGTIEQNSPASFLSRVAVLAPLEAD
jgi:hypothetical protein